MHSTYTQHQQLAETHNTVQQIVAHNVMPLEITFSCYSMLEIVCAINV